MISCPEIWTEFFEKYYSTEINDLAFHIKNGGDKKSLYVNFLRDLSVFQEGKLGEELIENPDEVLMHAEKGLACSTNIYGISLEGCKPRFQFLPPTSKILIRDLRGSHISKFIAIEGIIRKVTEVRPRVVLGAFKCLNCRNILQVAQHDATLRQPYECKCGSRRFHFIPEKSISVDSQRVKIQEFPENLRGGEQPQSIDVVLEGDLTGIINPGDRVIINGIVRAKPRSAQQRVLTHMDLFIEGNSIEMLQQEYEEFEITEKDREEIIKLAKSDDIYEKVIKTIAPSIYGYEDIKLAIALQLFGGVPKKLPDGTEIRGDIHVLLVGDPGVAKSQLLRYVHKIAPRSVYTTGKGTTSAGLTAT
ncbi:MAG: minichromosome maintenance protein MCM, partial [Archaeoglobaceae archaeon]|nr:minichromosome maintenance protein MCM [Archaeoglobaceae archaeon]